MDLRVALVFALLLLVGGSIVLGLYVVQWFKRCLQCGKRGLAIHPDPGLSVRGIREIEGRRTGFWTIGYLCKACGAELVDYNGQGLLTRQAYQAGATRPVPAATVVRAAPREDARGGG